MLEKLTLANFQAHERLAVRFDRVTCFVGPSDVGKTAVVRALRWLAENQPSGTAFVRHGAAVASVAAKFDGKWVVRRRGDGENVYQFEGTEYLSLRAPSVPDAIAQHLNLGPVNFQGQLDAPFWVLDTAGSVSRSLNEVVSLDEIDATLAAAASGVKASRAAVKVSEERLAAAKRRRDELDWVPEMLAALEALTALEQEHTAVVLERERLRYHLGELEVLHNRKGELDELVTLGERAFDAGLKAGYVAAERSALAGVLASLDEGERKLAELDELSEQFAALAGIRAEGDQAAESRRELGGLVDDLDELEERLCQLETDLAEAEKILRSEVAEGCPLCGQPVEPSSILSPTPTSRHGRR